MVTTKYVYFAAGTLSSSTLCRMYLVLRGLPFCDLNDLTFRGVKLHIPHLLPLFEACYVCFSGAREESPAGRRRRLGFCLT